MNPLENFKRIFYILYIMNVHKIKIKNFKSIYDELIIDFDNTQGFWKISGPVGAGKTTIGEAIIFGLYGNVKGKNNSDLISWGEKSGYIELWCTSNNNKLYIKRDYKASGSSPIYVEVNSEPLIFTNKKDAQKQLETEYYDISRITLELLCIISFNNFKSLSSLNPAETKKFLDEVFGFYILSNYSDNCKLKCSESLKILNSTKNEYNTIEQKISVIEKLTNTDRIEGDIQEQEKQKLELTEKLNKLRTDYKKKQDELNSKIIEQSSQSSNIKLIGKKLANEINFIKNGNCPTCGAHIDDSMLPDKEQERAILLKSYEESEEKLNGIKSKLNTLTNRFNEIERDLNSKMLNINSYIVKLKEQAKRDEVNTDEIYSLREELNKVKQEITKQEIEHSEWQELYGILSSEIRSNIISSFIPRINSSIQSYSQKLNQPYIIEFDNQFKCNIKLLNMENNIPISNLSTGQLKTVDMCIILGILDVIMHNVNFNICFLDELFSNMDGELRQLMCHVLKNNLKDGQILFTISHIELDDKYFNGEISAHLEYVNNSILKKSVYKITKF